MCSVLKVCTNFLNEICEGLSRLCDSPLLSGYPTLPPLRVTCETDQSPGFSIPVLGGGEPVVIIKDFPEVIGRGVPNLLPDLRDRQIRTSQ